MHILGGWACVWCNAVGSCVTSQVIDDLNDDQPLLRPSTEFPFAYWVGGSLNLTELHQLFSFYLICVASFLHFAQMTSDVFPSIVLYRNHNIVLSQNHVQALPVAIKSTIPTSFIAWLRCV